MARGGPGDATHSSDGRSGVGRRARTTPCSADVMGSQGPTAVHLSWWAQRPGAQAVVHGAPEAFSKHGQAQLRRQDATSRPMPQLSPAEFLASSPVVRTWMSCAESSGAPRTRSSLSRATPPHARYRARRQGAGSREPSPSRSVRSSSQRRCAAAPSSSSSKPGLSQKHERAAGQNCPGPAIDTQRKTTRLGPLGAEKAEIGPKNRDPDARTRLGAPDRVY